MPVTEQMLARDARHDGIVLHLREDHRPFTAGRFARRARPGSRLRFRATAAAAQEAGFRPCLALTVMKSSPDLGCLARHVGVPISRALTLIESGALDDGDVEALAGRLGIRRAATAAACSASISGRATGDGRANEARDCSPGN